MKTLILITGPSGCGKSSLAKCIVNELQLSSSLSSSSGTTISNSASTCKIVDTTNGTHAGAGDGTRIELLQQDDYFIKEFKTYKDRIDDSYENDSGVDWDRLSRDIVEKSASSTSASRFDGDDIDNGSGSGNGGCRRRPPTSPDVIVIVEGHILSSSKVLFSKRVKITNSNISNATANVNTKLKTHTNTTIQHQSDSTAAAATSTTTTKHNSYPYAYNYTYSYFDHVHIVLISCSKDICKNRRINRKRGQRSQNEIDELGCYYDQYVWPSYLKYGLAAKQSFRDTCTAAIAATAISSSSSSRSACDAESTTEITAESADVNTTATDVSTFTTQGAQGDVNVGPDDVDVVVDGDDDYDDCRNFIRDEAGNENGVLTTTTTTTTNDDDGVYKNINTIVGTKITISEIESTIHSVLKEDAKIILSRV